MPCDELIENYDKSMAVGKEFYALDPENPFAKAMESELARNGMRVVSEIRMYGRTSLRAQVDMTAKDPGTGYLTRVREVVEMAIDELHDMAVKFLPPIDPNKPLTFTEMRKHFHPKAPKDTLDKPLPPMRRRYVEIPIAELGGERSYAFKEVWEFVEEKVEVPPEPRTAQEGSDALLKSIKTQRRK